MVSLVGEIDDNMDVEVGYIPFPAPEGEAIFAGGLGSGPFVSATAENKAAAVAFLDFLASEEHGQWTVENLHTIPPQPIDTEGLDVSPLFAQVLEDISSFSEGGDFGYNIDVMVSDAFNEAMYDGMQGVMTGQSTPEDVAADLQAAVRAEVRVAGVQRPAACAGCDARLAQLVDRPSVVEHPLECAQLLVDGRQRADLRLEEVRSLAAEAAHVEDEPADVAERELARAAQEAQPAAQFAAVAEARALRADAVGRFLDDDLRLLVVRGGHGRRGAGRSGSAAGAARGLAPGQPLAPRPSAKEAGRKSAEQAGAATAS
ncbi:MAG: ABC transporter substrate-binding protein [Actinobacteria bacterium]|nr:ABC transporter substrate-binding protein [Actinomycetota bacterium]